MKQTKSLTQRFLYYLIIVILLSNLTVFGFQYYITGQHMSAQSKNAGLSLMDSNLTMIEQYFADVDKLASSIIFNRDVIRFMKSEDDKAADLELLYVIESLYYNSRPDLRMCFYKEKKYNNVYSIMRSTRNNTADDFRYSQWYQEIIWTDQSKVLLMNNTEETNPDFVHSLIYRIEDIYEERPLGYLKIDMDLKELKKRFISGSSQVAGTTISDESGNLLFYDGEIVEVPDALFVGNQRGNYETKDYMISYGVSESTGLRLVMAMSKSELFQTQNEMVRFLVMILVCLILMTALLSQRLFAVITSNFNRLVRGMQAVREGDFTVHVESDTNDEIGALIYEFNVTVKKVDELIKSIEAKQILIKEAEIKALQQQINPHFMHNIMETIMGLASEGMDDEIITVSECMSDMLRYNTNFQNTTTLRNELEQIQNYVHVLKIRFEDRFEFYYDIDESCMEAVMVKFTLQPLVENAISHGLSEVAQDGILRIRVVREEEQISIMIFDNGAGISEEKLEEMRLNLQVTGEHPLEYIDRYKSLGILNVHLRLRLYYGDAYSIEIFSKEGKGTCFSIKIPYILKGEEQGV